MGARATELEAAVDKQALLADVRADLVREEYPPVFIDRLIGLVDEHFTLEQIDEAKLPEHHRPSIYLMAVGFMIAVMTTILRAEQPTLVDIGFGYLVTLPFVPAAYWLARWEVRDKTFRDDVAVVFLRAGAGGMMAMGLRRFVRRRGARTDDEADALIRRWGWGPTASVQTQAGVWGLMYLAFGVAMWIGP